MPHLRSTLVLLAAATGLAISPRGAQAQGMGPEQALAAALRANPTLAAALADAVAARAARRAAENGHHAVFTAAADTGATERFSGTTAGIARNGDQHVQGSVGLAYTTEWGTVVSLGLDSAVQWRSTNRDPTTASAVTIPATTTAQATVSARQPVLRGAGRDAAMADVREAHASERQARFERDAAVSLLMRDVLSAYWELWYAERALAVEREALAVAERQREEARQRAEVLGTGARIDVLRFSSELASLRESVTTALATQRSASIELGRLMSIAPESATELVAAAPDPGAPEVPSVATLVASARQASPDLLALEAGVQAARERVVVSDDASQSRFDIVATGGVTGLWADDALPGLELPGDRPALFATLGIELELPFGPTAGAASLAESQARLLAAQMRYRASAQALEARIVTLHQQLAAARERVTLTTETAQIADELAVAEQQRLELGTTTPSVLLEAQQSARASALRHLRALVDVVAASLALDHASGRLLDRFSTAGTGARS